MLRQQCTPTFGSCSVFLPLTTSIGALSRQTSAFSLSVPPVRSPSHSTTILILSLLILPCNLVRPQPVRGHRHLFSLIVAPCTTRPHHHIPIQPLETHRSVLRVAQPKRSSRCSHAHHPFQFCRSSSRLVPLIHNVGASQSFARYHLFREGATRSDASRGREQ